MRQFTQDFQDHLDSGSTTLCFCWIVQRLDGAIYAFTDLDRTVTFLGLPCLPNPGFSTSADESSIQLTITNKEVSGFTDPSVLTADDIANGLWAGAAVDCFWVNYEDVSVFHYWGHSTIGNVGTSDIGFTFELVGLTQQLNLSTGRIYQRLCPESLGSTRCGIDLTATGNHGTGTITGVSGITYTASGLGSFANGLFTNGRIAFADGEVVTVKTHVQNGTTATITVWSVLNTTPEIGAVFNITRGCNKILNDSGGCKGFSNRANFRGYNLIPHNDVVSSYPTSASSANDGGSLFR